MLNEKASCKTKTNNQKNKTKKEKKRKVQYSIFMRNLPKILFMDIYTCRKNMKSTCKSYRGMKPLTSKI